MKTKSGRSPSSHFAYFSLLEHDPEIDVDNFSSSFVNQNVAPVSISYAEHVTNKTRHSNRTRVFLLRTVPRLWVPPKAFDKEESEDGRMVPADIVERFPLVFDRSLIQMISAKSETPLSRIVPRMCTDATRCPVIRDVVRERCCVFNPLKYLFNEKELA